MSYGARYKSYLIGLAFLGYCNSGFAEPQISGFASVVAGKVTQGNEFLADYPKTGIYDEDWSFSPDTTLGIQITSQIDDKSSFVIQAVSHHSSTSDISLDWAYFNYQLSPEISLQAGRKRLPLYYYSDFFDLGFAYHWIRPPADNYTWQISNYNGVNLLYQPINRHWDILFNFYLGREDSENNKLLSKLTGGIVDETWKNMLGTVAEISHDWFEFRATYMRSQLDRSINGSVTDKNIKQSFNGVSVNLNFNELSLFTEYNQYRRPGGDISVDTSMVSLTYRIGDFTPHVTRSEFKQKPNLSGGDEQHQTTSLGIRWELNPSTALKLQYDKVNDKAVNVPVLGDAEAVSIGIDFVF